MSHAFRARRALSVVVALVTLAVVPVRAVRAVDVPGTVTFSTPGCTTWSVPGGVQQIEIQATGAAGNDPSSFDDGGRGDGVAATLSTLGAATTLFVCVAV